MLVFKIQKLIIKNFQKNLGFVTYRNLESPHVYCTFSSQNTEAPNTTKILSELVMFEEANARILRMLVFIGLKTAAGESLF